MSRVGAKLSEPLLSEFVFWVLQAEAPFPEPRTEPPNHTTVPVIPSTTTAVKSRDRDNRHIIFGGDLHSHMLVSFKDSCGAGNLCIPPSCSQIWRKRENYCSSYETLRHEKNVEKFFVKA